MPLIAGLPAILNPVFDGGLNAMIERPIVFGRASQNDMLNELRWSKMGGSIALR